MKKIIFILFLTLTTIGGCMYPKFEHNIEDQYTITQNNRVGAEDRGNVAIVLDTPLDIHQLPQRLGGNDCESIKEIIAYALSNGNDTIDINFDVDINEIHFNIPDRKILQAGDGYNVSINLTDFEKARYNYADITVGAVGGDLYFDVGLSQFYPSCANSDDLYYLKSDGTFDTLTRSNISGKTYLAVACNTSDDYVGGWTYFHDIGLVNTGSQLNLYSGNTLLVSALTNVNTTSPYMIIFGSGHIAEPNGIFIRHTSKDKIVYAYGGSQRADIVIKDPDDANFDADYWYVGGSLPTGGWLRSLAGALKNGSYITYIYTFDGTYFASAELIKTINAKIITMSPSYTYRTGSKVQFVGGSQVWAYDSTNWALQLSLTFEPDNAKFIRAGNMLYFVVGNTTTGRLEIWKKSLNNTSSTWILVRRYFNKSMLYLSHYYDSSTFGLRILFKNTIDSKLYYFINKTITLTNRGQLNGIVVNNNASFYDLGQDEFGNEIFTTPLINGTNNGGIITYSSLYANDLNILNWTWIVQSSILKSNKNVLYYKGSSSPAYTDEFKNNLILCGGWAVKLEKSTGTPSFSGATFKNNTIKSVNGMSLCAVSSLTCKNNIIDCSYTAFDITSTTSNLTVSNSIVNGQVDEQVTLSTCLEATNPLFKDVYNDDYMLMSKAEGYPKDSKAIKYGDDGKDAGCYDVTRTNNGETLKETFELTNFVAEIMRAWEYQKKETGFDYRGNFLKTMSNGTRLIKLSEQNGLDLDKVDYLEYLIGKDEVMRFYPNGDDGLKYIIDYSTATARTWKNSATLTLNFTTMTATAPANHKFQRGYLKGAWLIVAIPPSTIQWYYITDNSETVLYLENKEAFTPPANSTYTGTIQWYYVKTADTIDYLNGIWEEINQQGIIPSLTLYVVESKEV